MTDRSDDEGTPTRTGEASVRARADALIARMTPAEKAGQLTQYFYFNLPPERLAELAPETKDRFESQPAAVERALREGRAGSVLFVADPTVINRLQRAALDGSRHGIPLIFGFDVIHGLRTVFPVPIAMAASWDPTLAESAQAIAAAEARAVGIHWTFAPMVDIARDPRWGRIVEGAGEDPYLGAAIAAAQVRGFQGAAIGAPDRVIAGPKHFAGYGAALGGRDYDEANLSDDELWNVYLPPFAAAVEAGAGNVMTAYMPLNGVPATGNRRLLTEILRDGLRFEGFTVSDANAVRNLVTHGFARDLPDAAVRALNAGVDMEMATSDAAYATLPEALERGLITEAQLDNAVRRVLEAKLRLGLFESPYVDEDRAEAVLSDPEHRVQARIAAERSAVLLRNAGGLLPLDPARISSIAVIGPLADSQRDTLGPWTIAPDVSETVTVLEGIRNYAGDRVRVEHAPGVRIPPRTFPSPIGAAFGDVPEDQSGFDDDAELDRAIGIASAADVVIAVLGEKQDMIGEASSRSSLELPGRQLDLLQALVATGKPVALLLMSGRPLDLRWAAEHVPAILAIWYPGTRGGEAVANLLFGAAVPGGKLPFTWPRAVGHVPLIYAHTRSHDPDHQGTRYWDEASTPLFPFGYGLSYSDFSYTNLAVEPTAIAPGGTLTVTVEVTNDGQRRADEVAQLYIHQRYGAAARPVRELKGFQRLTLDPGETRTVRFTLGPDELRYWSDATRDWTIDPATFDVWVGGDSTATLAATFAIEA